MEIFIENKQVKFTQGVQTFSLSYEGNKKELKWMAEQLDTCFKNFMHEIKMETINEYTEKTIQHLISNKEPKIVCPDCGSDMITQFTSLDNSCQSCGYLW